MCPCSKFETAQVMPLIFEKYTVGQSQMAVRGRQLLTLGLVQLHIGVSSELKRRVRTDVSVIMIQFVLRCSVDLGTL